MRVSDLEAAMPAFHACVSIVRGLEETSAGGGGASSMEAALAAAALRTWRCEMVGDDGMVGGGGRSREGM